MSDSARVVGAGAVVVDVAAAAAAAAARLDAIASAQKALVSLGPAPHLTHPTHGVFSKSWHRTLSEPV